MTRTVRNHSVTSQNHVRPLCQLLAIHLRRIVTEQHTLGTGRYLRALHTGNPRQRLSDLQPLIVYITQARHAQTQTTANAVRHLTFHPVLLRFLL